MWLSDAGTRSKYVRRKVSGVGVVSGKLPVSGRLRYRWRRMRSDSGMAPLVEGGCGAGAGSFFVCAMFGLGPLERAIGGVSRGICAV